MNTIAAIASVLLVLNTFMFVILYHEYGHAWAASKLGFKVSKVKAGNSLKFRWFKWAGIDREYGLPSAKFKLGEVEHEIGILPGWGQCFIEGLDTASNKSKFLIAAAGPFSTVLMGLAFYIAGTVNDASIFYLLSLACLEFAAINLIPISRLDGGVMLKAAWPTLKQTFWSSEKK